MPVKNTIRKTKRKSVRSEEKKKKNENLLINFINDNENTEIIMNCNIYNQLHFSTRNETISNNIVIFCLDKFDKDKLISIYNQKNVK